MILLICAIVGILFVALCSLRHVRMQGKLQGQSLVEYSLILVLVAVVVIVVLALLGPSIGNIFSNIVQNLTVNGGS